MIETEGVSILRNGMREWINSDSYRAERWAQHELSSACTPPVVAAVLAHIDAQAAEIERLRADADRYRHIRACNDGAIVIMPGEWPDDDVLLTGDTADAAIDAEMAKLKEKS